MISFPKAPAVSLQPKVWTSTSGAVRAHPQSVAFPQSVEALQSLVLMTSRRGGTIRPLGAGQACSPIMVTDDTMVSLQDLNIPPVEINNTSPRPLVTLAAGASIGLVSQRLAEYGYALPQMFSPLATETVGGLLATGSRGCIAMDKPLHSYVTAVQIIDGKGFLRWITDPEELLALRCSLGASGIIVRVGMRMVPLANMAVTRVSMDAEVALQDFDMHIRDHSHSWLDWQPMANQARLTIMDKTPVEVTKKPQAFIQNYIRSLVPTVGAVLPVRGKLAALGSAALWSTEQEILPATNAVPPTDVYGVHHMGATLPLDTWQAAVYGAFDIMERLDLRSPLPVRIEASKKDDTAYLSPAIEHDGINLTFSALPMSRPGKFFRVLTAMLRELGGRPNWDGVHALTHEDMKTLYPDLDNFNKVRSKYDPDGLFLNKSMASLFLGQ